MTPESYADWYAHLQTSGPRMSVTELEACARLATVLLCGEQSAIQIFSAEVRRARAPAEALNVLRAIEVDEQLHENALRAFCEHLPRPGDGHALKRRAQRFFASLGRADDMARHFGQISHLDSAVCKIMWHVEKSSISSVSPLRQIAAMIKNDEARHVVVSRRYASLLGLTSRKRVEDGIAINESLVEMLDPLAESFETVGVDSDRLFAHIRRTRAL
jgi:hypothetical protein